MSDAQRRRRLVGLVDHADPVAVHELGPLEVVPDRSTAPSWPFPLAVRLAPAGKLPRAAGPWPALQADVHG